MKKFPVFIPPAVHTSYSGAPEEFGSFHGGLPDFISQERESPVLGLIPVLGWDHFKPNRVCLQVRKVRVTRCAGELKLPLGEPADGGLASLPKSAGRGHRAIIGIKVPVKLGSDTLSKPFVLEKPGIKPPERAEEGRTPSCAVTGEWSERPLGRMETDGAALQSRAGKRI